MSFDVFIKRGLTDSVSRRLIINADSISFENKDYANDTVTVFKKGDIESYSYGINWMQYYFIFGREYIIKIKDVRGNILKINFKTYFGRNIKKLNSLYADILNALWDNHFSGIMDSYLYLHKNNIPFTLGNVDFTSEGVSIKVDKTISYNKKFIPWQKVRTRNYHTYFAIYSDDEAQINSIQSYKEDWNTEVLYSVIRTILSNKSIEVYS